MILTSTADSRYIDYIRVLVKSTRMTNPSYVPWVQLIDCDEYVTEFERLGCRVSILSSPNNIDRTKKYIKKDDAESLSSKTTGRTMLDPDIRSKVFFSEYECFCTHARFLHIQEVLSVMNPDECCIVADADTIIRGNLYFIDEALYSAELCMRYDDSKKHIEFVNEGFMGIRNTATSRKFFNYVNRVMREPAAKVDWDYDTYALNKAYTEFPQLRLFKLPAKYKDNKLNEESTVWSGSSLAKDDERYKKEMALYR